MNKSELIKIVAEKNEMSHAEAESVVTHVFEAMAAALKDGRRIELRGFGTFITRDYNGYLGRNPRTGEAVSVAPKRLPFFKVGKDVKEAVNG